MKGIILAGGSGTRLYPITQIVCKQLLPIYDKPLIYYPLSVLLFAGIRDIIIISTPYDIPFFKKLLGDGTQFGIHLSYKIQKQPKGIAEAFIIAEDFIGTDSVCLILGDNIFYGDGLPRLMKDSISLHNGATIFGYYVNDPERYGVVELDKNGSIISIEEKPENPKSNFAIVGLYFYDNDVIQIAKNIKPSARGELEITDINKNYFQNNRLNVTLIGRGYAWLDTGTHNSMIDAAFFVKAIEERQGLKISCIEEIAYRMGFIDKQQLIKLAQPLLKSGYGEYLMRLIDKDYLHAI